MEINGRVIQVLPEQSGEGKNGTWRKQDFILETESQYPKKICFTVWGDRINPDLMQEGKQLMVSFDVESREYNGRWYTDVKAWRIDPMTEGGSTPPPSAAPPSYAPSSAPSGGQLSDELKGSDNDLPF